MSQSALEGLPPMPGAAQQVPSFLGVPDGYTRGRPLNPLRGETGRFPDFTPNVGGQVPQFPQYPTGSEFAIADLSVENLARLQQRMVRAGLIGPKTQFRLGVADDTTMAAYRDLLAFANRYTITDVAALDMLETSPQALDTDGDAQSGPQTVTRTDTAVNLTDPVSARAVLRRTLEAELGRTPTDSEYAQFVASLNSAEQAAPSMTTTTAEYGADGQMLSSDSFTEGGGPDPGAYADEYARAGEMGTERNTRMAGTDYYDVALAALGPGGGML